MVHVVLQSRWLKPKRPHPSPLALLLHLSASLDHPALNISPSLATCLLPPPSCAPHLPTPKVFERVFKAGDALRRRHAPHTLLVWRTTTESMWDARFWGLQASSGDIKAAGDLEHESGEEAYGCLRGCINQRQAAAASNRAIGMPTSMDGPWHHMNGPWPLAQDYWLAPLATATMTSGCETVATQAKMTPQV